LRAGLEAVTQSDPIHPALHRSPENAAFAAAISGIFPCALEPLEAKSVSYRGTAAEDKMPVSIRFPRAFSESFE
jgi:hypothetical protein